ncbi:MAG: hypothetical protein WA324_13630 [Bryobacteraceae bacterium]
MLSERVLRGLTRIPGALSFWCHFPVGSLDLRVRYGIFSRPHYAYGVYTAAELAARLNIPAISVVEFGVAGGRGLVALESIATEVSSVLGVKISVYGFDTGAGMPAPLDYRDVPHVWGEGFYKMDEEGLKRSLKQAFLILGDVASTVPAFLQNRQLPPIGFVAFDLDYYSSTKNAMRLFEGAPESRLPRVRCYFDDIIGENACHNEYIGELCAIREFNIEHMHLKVCPIHMLSHVRQHPAAWNEQMYVLHDFQHPLYCVNITPKTELATQLPR